MNVLKYLAIQVFTAACLACTAASAQTTDAKAVAELLKQGGYVVVFRHGATNRDQADTDPLNHENTARQRLLSDNGRNVAVQIGQTFKAQQISFGKTYTSKFYRAVETGKLLSDSSQTALIDITEGGLVVSPIENDRRAEALRKLAATAPDAGKNTLLVTHKPNIIDAFGKDWFEVKEGEATVFRPDAMGKAVVVARVQAADWLKLSK